jgi:hypothetical protein
MLALALLLFAETWRILERCQAAAGLRLWRFLAATDRCQNGRGADQPAEEEGLQAVPPLITVHATILGVIVRTLGDLLLDVAAGVLVGGIEPRLDAAALCVARQWTMP